MNPRESEILHSRAEHLLKISSGLSEIFEKRGIEFEVEPAIPYHLDYEGEDNPLDDQVRDGGYCSCVAELHQATN